MSKIVLLIVPPILIAGIVGGLAYVDIVHIPGISPVKKKKAIEKDDVTFLAFGQGIAGLTRKLPAYKPPKPPAPKADPVLGEKKLASLWNTIDAAKLAGITEKWKDADLAPILLRMDEEQVGKLIASLKPERAATLCEAMRRRAANAAIVAKS